MNYYQILGLNYNSNEELIKKTFRKLSFEHHPDRGGEEKLYQQITEAYTVLSNPNSKKEYDDLLFKKKDVFVETSYNEENSNNNNACNISNPPKGQSVSGFAGQSAKSLTRLFLPAS